MKSILKYIIFLNLGRVVVYSFEGFRHGNSDYLQFVLIIDTGSRQFIQNNGIYKDKR